MAKGRIDRAELTDKGLEESLQRREAPQQPGVRDAERLCTALLRRPGSASLCSLAESSSANVRLLFVQKQRAGTLLQTSRAKLF